MARGTLRAGVWVTVQPPVMGVLVDAHDLLFALLIIVVFVFLGLCAKAAEKL